MARETTLPRMLWPLMDGASVDTPYCCVCGRTDLPLNRHHVVRRAAGSLYRDGVEVPKPTLMLCGSGNGSGCHRLAHQNRLHFRWVASRPDFKGRSSPDGGHWEFALFDSPTRYSEALERGEWHSLRGPAPDFQG